MPKITAVKQQKRKGRFNIYVDGKFAFGLSAETLVKSGLKIGQEISEKEIEILRHKDTKSKFYNRALGFLSYRPRSEKEIRDYLIKKIHGDQGASKTVESIIKKLKLQGLINDSEFVKWWIEQRQMFRPKGIYALRQELRQKGISKQAMDSLIANYQSLTTEHALAFKVAQKKLRTLRNLTPRATRSKLSAFLLRRGFSYETVKLTLDEILKKK